MYINKLLKQTSNSIDNSDSERQNTNIKLKISSSSKNYPNINYTFLPKLNESESHQTIKRNNEYLELEENTNTDYKEELNVITSLWDELGVTEDYKYQFNQILESNNYNSKIIFIQEKENLQKFKTSLIKLKKGCGNNGKDKTEGARYKNVFGTYLHGSFLPKNPQFADYMIELALEKRYGEHIALSPLNDEIELKTHNSLVGKPY